MPVTGTEATALAVWQQLHDSAFPSGRLVHSNGLEEWLSDRPEAGSAEIEAAVRAFTEHGCATLDATVAAHAWRAEASVELLVDLDELIGTYKLFDNARTASVSAGRQMATTAEQIGMTGGHPFLRAVLDGRSPGHGAVVDGVLQAVLGVPQHLAVLGVLRATMASLLSVAVRLGRLGPLHSQRIQLRAAEELVALADAACTRALTELSGTTPALEISGMRHEQRTARLFAT